MCRTFLFFIISQIVQDEIDVNVDKHELIDEIVGVDNENAALFGNGGEPIVDERHLLGLTPCGDDAEIIVANINIVDHHVVFALRHGADTAGFTFVDDVAKIAGIF